MPDDHDRLEAELYRSQWATYRGWTFSRDLGSGSFNYWRNGPYTVYFTPDWSTPGMVDIQVADEEGEPVQTAEIPFPIRTAEELFRIVKPWLDEYTRRRSRPRRRSETSPEEWSPQASAGGGP